MVSFSLRQCIFLPPPIGPSPVSFHLSQFAPYFLPSSSLPLLSGIDNLNSSEESKVSPVRVFISYSHDSREHPAASHSGEHVQGGFQCH